MRQMLRGNEKTALIKSVPLFQHCSKKELADVASIADELDLPEGKVLTREGDRGREFFVLVDGTVEIRRGGEKLDDLGPGDFFGEIALITKGPRTATVTATSPIEALVIEGRAFRALLDRTPGIAVKVMLALAERVPTAVPE